MKNNELIEIPLSKQKLILTLLGCIVFIGHGIWFVFNPPIISTSIFKNPTIFLISGILSITFSGIIAVFVLKKLSDKKAGLIINEEGIIDNSSGVSAGLIPWTDIEEIKNIQVMSQKFLMIIVKNPQDYLDKIQNKLKKKTMEINYKSYGSPISISSNALKTDFDNLHNLLTEKFNKHK